MPKVNCAFHDDATASMELYSDGFYHCFGCGAHGLQSALGGKYQNTAYSREPKEKEDLEASIAAISALPTANIRGLVLPTDGNSYYIVWPDKNYYNRRLFEGEPKYKCPSGHTKQVFKARMSGSNTLALVEGEINALSLALCHIDADIVSPGGSGDFYSKHAIEHFYPEFKKYKRIFVFADEDKAGAIACIEFVSRMKPHVPDITICLLRKDFNAILVGEGVSELERQAKAKMGMP